MISQMPSSILGTSMINQSQRLIPKIQTQKLKLDPLEQKNTKSKLEEGLTLENGKFLINQSMFSVGPKTVSGTKEHSILKSLELPSTKSFKKLDKLQLKPVLPTAKGSTIEEHKDEDILGQNNISVIDHNRSNFLQSHANNNVTQLKSQRKIKVQLGRKKNQRKREDDDDFLTPQDFIQLIRSDPDMADEFTYLNKRNHAYDFKIVDFNEKHRDEYMTISARVKEMK